MSSGVAGMADQQRALYAFSIALGLIVLCVVMVVRRTRDRAKRALVVQPPLVGQLFIFRPAGARYRAVKVIGVGDDVVHLRMYSNEWRRPPRRLSIEELVVKSAPADRDHSSSDQLMPLSEFSSLKLHLVGLFAISEEEAALVEGRRAETRA
jgi:hypothetical protein